MKGIIVLWGGAIVDIPAGWHLCDGSVIGGRTLPDLRDKFVVGAGDTYAVGDTGATNVVGNAGLEYYALAFIIKL